MMAGAAGTFAWKEWRSSWRKGESRAAGESWSMRVLSRFLHGEGKPCHLTMHVGVQKKEKETALCGLVREGNRPLGLVGDAQEEGLNAGPALAWVFGCWA